MGLVIVARSWQPVATPHALTNPFVLVTLSRRIGLTLAAASLLLGASSASAQTGVTCNAICPGWVLTPLVQKQIDARAERDGIAVEQAKRALLAEKQPSGEFATPEQIGAVCVFLCSEAAAQIRGAAVPVDGGWLAQ